MPELFNCDIKKKTHRFTKTSVVLGRLRGKLLSVNNK